MTARRYLLISDAAAPFAEGESPLGVVALARALSSAGASATVLSLGTPEQLATMPGLARRLRTFRAQVGGEERELAFFEGSAPLSQARMVLAAAVGQNRGQSAALLAQAVRALRDEELLKADVAIGWGETSAPALAVTTAGIRLFVLPSGRPGSPLGAPELADVSTAAGEALVPVESSPESLTAIGAAAASVIIAPSPSSARLLGEDPGLARRASDEPVMAIRFGCDDPPHDPATDPALPAHFAAKSLTGKLECRRSVGRRLSLNLGPRTLLLLCAPLRASKGGEQILATLASLTGVDAAALVPAEGDPELIAQARRLAIANPGRIAIAGENDTEVRVLRAAADAMLFGDPDDRTGRAAGLAQRYGTLPIVLDNGAAADYLVDYDSSSRTGTAIFYDSSDANDISGAVRRVVALRSAPDEWTVLVQRLLDTPAKWGDTASAIEEVSATFA